MTNNDKVDTVKTTANQTDRTPVTDAKHDDAGIKNAIKSKVPGNHANAKNTAKPGSQGTIDLHKRKSV